MTTAGTVNWTAHGVKIGRRSDVDLAVAGADVVQIARAVHAQVRSERLLASHDIDVEAEMSDDDATCSVTVHAGGRRVGEFTLARVTT